jgi:hypothetical protein
MTALKEAQQAVTRGDEQDAVRVVGAATIIAGWPTLMSPAARALAVARLREMMRDHPSKAEILSAIVQHLESYSP